MSNKIALATIQFRADAKGVNPALDSLRKSSKDAHDEVDRLQEALNKGIKTMQDVNGVDFDVAKKLDEMNKKARNFDQSIRELLKGATALESVVKNIRLGEIEQSSRAELKGAIKGAEARKRSVRESDPEDLAQQRDLNKVIEESQKQLNKLDRDTEKVIETIQNGGTIAEATLNKEMKGLREILMLTEKGTDEWNKYNAQLQQIEAHVANIRKQERESASALLGSQDFGQYSEEQIRTAISNAKELLSTYKTAIPEAKTLADNIVRAEQYLKNYGVEAARAAVREQEQLQLEQDLARTMNRRLRDLKNLSADALAETRKYWEAQRNGAAEGTTEFNKAEAALKKIDGFVRNTRKTELKSILGDPSQYSVTEVKNAVQEIEKLRDSVQKGIPVWHQYNNLLEQGRTYLNNLAKNEAAERIEKQMRNLSTVSASGLQEVKKYWETMVAGAERGSQELADYEAKLKQVVNEENERTKAKGEEVLNRFRGDVDYENKVSDKQLKEDVDALKAYRESLPKEGNLSLIREIDYYIGLTAKSAKDASQAVMSLADAEALAGKLGTKGFSASTDQLKAAKKALEEAQNAAGRGTKRFTELQAAINKIDLELAKTGELSSEVQAVLNQPKGKSFNELKQAVEQGRKALNSMRTDTKEGKKAFDELSAKVKEADLQLKQLGNTAKGSASAFDKAWSRLKTYITLYVGAAVAMQKITQTMGDLMKLSDKMGEVRKTTGYTADEVGRLSDNLAKLDTRTPIEQLLSISARGGQLGLKAQEDIQGFTEAANKLMVALPEMGEESATSLMKISKATGDLKRNGDNVQETLERVGSTIIALRANSASAAPAITDFVSRVGAVGAQAGITIDQIAALGSTVDALGGRVEMSATALSRMIPAIRNNSFAVANAIGVTEKSLKDLFNSGRAMDAMVLIFDKMRESVKQFDTSTEEGMNAMADSVEQMLGKSATMQEVMKTLNQQGARAGIVFGLLSQNVDELKNQLRTASEAYKDNTALLNEYNNMNETTAAKWERLKNSIEEWFVKDSMQRWLGNIIDMLRKFADWFASDGPLAIGFKMMIAYAAAMKLNFGAAFVGIGSGLSKLTIALKAGLNQMGLFTRATANARLEWKKLDLAMKANIWGAIISAVTVLAMKMWEWHKAAKEAAAEVGRFNQKMADEKKALDNLFDPLNKSNLAQKERLDLIKQINNKYGKYLGYMLSETSSAIQLADAHALIAKRIKEEAYERRIAEKEKKIQEEYDEDLSADYGKIVSRVRSGAKGGADVERIADSLKSLVDQNIEKIEKRWGGGINLAPEFSNKLNGFLERLVADGELSKNSVSGVRSALISYMNDAKSQHNDIMSQTANLRSDLRNIQGAIKYDLANNINTLVSKVASTVGNAVRNIKQQQQQQNPPLMLQPQGNGSGINLPNLFGGQQQGGWSAPWQQTRETTPNQQMAPAGWKPNIDKKNVEQVRQFVADQDALRSALQSSGEQLDEAQRKVAESWLLTDEQLKEYRKIIQKADYSPGGSKSNPYGNYNKVTSPYSEWNGDDLVARRKEMLERVKALANGADVQAVLSEDARFITDAVRKNIKTTNDAIEWYNSERLKIQDALHAKHLTNTGDWLDPKAQRRASRVVKDEMKYYLDELDAYYTERKAKIQDAQNDQEISEAEARNRTLANEAEWQQRRAELQLLYSKKRGEVTQAEQDAIYNIISERTGETTGYIKADIAQTIRFIQNVGAKSKAAMDRIYGDLELDAEKSFLRQRNAIGQHMKAIQDILDKERPFNGITKDLETSLTTMGILTSHMNKERDELMAKNADMTKFNEKQAEEAYKEMTFLLGEAENAYSTTAEEVMQRAAKAGLTAWVEEMKQNPQMQEGLMAQLRSTFDTIQDAIKKEASQLKKEAEIMWNNILMPDGQTTMKQAFDKTISTLGIEQGRVNRANSLIGAGQASERVADKLAIKQMQVQMAMQKAYYDLMRKRGLAQVEILKQQSEELKEQGKLEEAKRKSQDAQHVQMALNLATTKEQTELLKLEEDLTAKVEESQNRLYTELKEWGELLSSSLKSIFEASNAGNAEYYNELAKMNLTGKGGPGAGTYVVIDNEGTSDATAHYEYLDERQALERQHEIEQENARAEALEKAWDDINAKINDVITDQINAMLQNQSIDANTSALNILTAAVNNLAGVMVGAPSGEGFTRNAEGFAVDESGQVISPIQPTEPTEQTGGLPKAPWQMTDDELAEAQEKMGLMWQTYTEQGTGAMQMMAENLAETPGVTPPWQMTEEQMSTGIDKMNAMTQAEIDASNRKTQVVVENANKEVTATTNANKKTKTSTQSSFAAMAAACNMYGLAYQTVTNDNLSSAQKFQLFALQAAGQTAIGMLTTDLFMQQGKAAVELPGILGKAASQLGPIAGPIAFAAMTALLGGLMGLAVSKVAKSKSQISQVTGASVGAGRLATGMLTYGEGNVNEFTDPNTLTPGRQYNVDSADGKTYRARYMGKDAKTHITNGPEFHLVGEKGREAIIDAHTTRKLQMDDSGIWQSIQTLYNGGRISRRRSVGRGVRAFADGNVDEFEEMESGYDMATNSTGGMNGEQLAAFQSSIDKNNELLERALTEGIHARFDVYGKGGLVDSYDTGKKNVTRHGEKY